MLRGLGMIDWSFSMDKWINFKYCMWYFWNRSEEKKSGIVCLYGKFSSLSLLSLAQRERPSQKLLVFSSWSLREAASSTSEQIGWRITLAVVSSAVAGVLFRQFINRYKPSYMTTLSLPKKLRNHSTFPIILGPLNCTVIIFLVVFLWVDYPYFFFYFWWFVSPFPVNLPRKKKNGKIPLRFASIQKSKKLKVRTTSVTFYLFFS